VLAIGGGSEATAEELLGLGPIGFAAEQSQQLSAPAKPAGRHRRSAA
jgi:hypothetical protein